MRVEVFCNTRFALRTVYFMVTPGTFLFTCHIISILCFVSSKQAVNMLDNWERLCCCIQLSLFLTVKGSYAIPRCLVLSPTWHFYVTFPLQGRFYWSQSVQRSMQNKYSLPVCTMVSMVLPSDTKCRHWTRLDQCRCYCLPDLTISSS